ncbi:MAG TPA: BA14K family protein [Afifellaceae bacterium]|nr:BA14K family protein [Afifellaceae bacterium]
MFRKLAISALGATLLLTSPLPALAMPLSSGLPVVKNDSVQLIGHRHFRKKRAYYNGYYNGGRYYRHRHYRHRRHSDGAAIVAGIIGLSALAIASSNRRHVYYVDRYYNDRYYDDRYYSYRSGSVDWIAACARKYRSFNPRTGLYRTYSGHWRRCRLP